VSKPTTFSSSSRAGGCAIRPSAPSSNENEPARPSSVAASKSLCISSHPERKIGQFVATTAHFAALQHVFRQIYHRPQFATSFLF
jgi:hypothetical protein